MTFPEVVARLEGVDQEAVLAAGVAVADRVRSHCVRECELVRNPPRHEAVAGAAAVLAHPSDHRDAYIQWDAQRHDGHVHAGEYLECEVTLCRAMDAVVFHQHAQVRANRTAVELKGNAFSSV